MIDDADDRWIDDLLTKTSDQAHVADAGFTAGVLARLPAVKRTSRRRDVAIALSALAAGVVGVLALEGSGLAFSSVGEMSLAQQVGLVVIVGLALWGAFASAEAS